MRQALPLPIPCFSSGELFPAGNKWSVDHALSSVHKVICWVGFVSDAVQQKGTFLPSSFPHLKWILGSHGTVHREYVLL